MLIAGVLCLCAAVASTMGGLWTLRRPPSGDPGQQVLRAMAPTQLAAAVLLGVGGAVALAGPPHGAVPVLAVCVLGAVGTLAAGSWQGARYLARREAAAACTGSCASCTLSCH
ncbi:hypothetical protein ACAG26_14565 [Mycobacterium sp. pUA109]|uniref:hypothetical protein n=1 Tax=Mycobacterium sp. pUA109 TaxID=3238982 RepID=UPI00351BCAEA